MSFVAPIALLLYAIGRGVSGIAGEEENHTLELLLSTPLGRTRILLEKFVAMATSIAFLAAVTGVALVAGGGLADMGLSPRKVAAAMVHLALLALVFGTLALALSAVTGRTGLSRGVPAALAVAGYVNGPGDGCELAPAPPEMLSHFYQYVGHDPLRNGVDLPSVAIAAATCLALLGLAAPSLVL